MIQTGIESRVKIQDIISNQLPEFILDESPKAVDFLKQYYISQEYQGGPIDLTDNLDQYLKVDNLKPEVIVDSALLSNDVTSTDTIIEVSSTKGFPNEYGLLKIDDEIITYTGITSNTFTGCIRGFSGISEFDQNSDNKDLIFSTSTATSHKSNAPVQNLSSLFLKEFYIKLKSTFTPGLENISFAEEIDAGNFIKRAKDFYSSKGTDEAIKILFKVIFGESPSIINLEDYLIKPSFANYVRREIVIAEVVSGEPLKIIGETLIKNTDATTTASISAVEPFARKGKTFYKIELYISNDGRSSVEGNFEITPNTKLIESALVGDNILTVDSTLSFPESGTLISGNNIISYTGKSVNQFFGCTGITTAIAKSSNIRSNDTYFSYENGDVTKKVELIIFGVISDLKQESENFKTSEGDLISIKNIGDKIKNNGSNWKEIFANSLIYNTSTRYEIVNNNSNELASTIDRSSLKIGDEVEILERESEIVVTSSNPVYITNIDKSQNTLTLENKPNLSANTKYDIRRKLNKTKSSGSTFESDSLLSDVLNLYVDKDEYAYIASNSLPSGIKSNFTLNNSIIKNYRLDVQESVKSVTISNLSNFTDLFDEVYNTFEVDNVPFLTGEEVFYSSEGETLVGLTTGTYFVKKISNRKFKLYGSQSTISSGSNLTFQVSNSGIGTHTFVLNSQKENDLGIQKILRKFPLEKNIKEGSGTLTVPGKIGMLINGVEINNYKSDDAVYFGPINDANVLFGGEDYDVINLPRIVISDSAGSGAKIQPVISGKFEKIYVDTQDYDIDKIASIDISGGNGSGAVIEPVLITKPREVLFNADEFSSGGGVNETTNQIVFLTDHNFVNGEQVSYNSLGNTAIKIGTLTNNEFMPDNSTYFVEVTNNKAIKLYFNLEDQQSQTNPVGIFTGSLGSHKFSTVSSKKQIDSIKIINSGEGYTNRKLIVNPTGISTVNNLVNFTNHGFNDGELVSYDYETTQISGISSANQYYVLKVDNDSFRLCNAGVGGTITSNYERLNYEKFNSTGSGEQYFKYPDISVSIQYTTAGIGSTTQIFENLVVTPVVKGEIIDAYVYESGVGYGSTIINYQRKPTVTVQNGKSAQLTPVVVGGKLTNVSISYQGTEYYSVPDLVVSGTGTGAELRAIIDDNGQISEVKVINTGIGYSSSNTSIKVISSGKNAFIDPQIRKLSINNNHTKFSAGEVLSSGKDKLQYSVSKYFESLRDSFLEDGTLSGIIGWAYDGNPIYGPTAYSDPNNIFSTLKTIESGYTLNTSNVTDRPSGFSAGFFVEDYKFDGSGDLDEYNGRYEKNDEYPNGVYAYHATLDEFPYFIGNKYRSELLSDSNLDQSFDLNNSNLLRNTLPYKASEKNANYDFVSEISDILDQKIEVISVTSDSIKSLEIQNSGTNYKVGDKLIFNEDNTFGSGLDVDVKSVKGKDITNIETTTTSYENSIFTWNSPEKVKISILPNHNLSNLDFVTISGFSTNLSTLNGTHKISVPSYTNARCLSTITSSGITTEIYVAPIPEQISVGSSIGIGTETLKILGIFRNENILRIERGVAGTSHTVGTAVSFLPDSFTISKSLEKFDSDLNDKVFFNPRESVGISTINGVGYSTSFIFGNISVNNDIPSKSINIHNHPFKNNQPVVYTANGSNINVSTDGLSSSVINLPANLFVINKNPDLIGLKTAINGDELFFHSNGDDNDLYSLESDFTQVLGNIDKREVSVSVSTAHELQNGDTITLNVQPNLSVGIGTSTAVRVVYNSQIGNIVVNPIGFNSTGINTSTNEFTINNHEFETGDKVLYEDSGCEEYFVFKIDNNRFKLCETYFDSQQNPPTIVSFASTGTGSQSLSLINPKLNPIKNNNLVFDLSDSSLTGYDFKIYSDSKFNSEFISVGSTDQFIVSKTGTVGSAAASLVLNYNSDIPEELYYTLDKDGTTIKSDIEVKNYSAIKYEESVYNNTYRISGIGATTFNLNIFEKPERSSYISTECDILNYSTTSNSASGPVNSLNALSFGFGYKSLPILKSTNSTNGSDLIVNPISNTVGTVKEKKILNNKFTYSSDRTLRPKANVSPTIVLEDFNTLDQVLITNSGDGYSSAPTLVIVDSVNRNIINSGLIRSKVTASSISSVDIDVAPTGLPDESVEIFATNNTNGVAIISVNSISPTKFECNISTPGIGTFAVQPFNEGDEVFIEGIQKFGSDGDGFNSEDYGFKFFTVTEYKLDGINDTVVISVSGLTTNTGIAKTVQDYSGVLINKNDYPQFEVTQKLSEFLVGESLSSNEIVRDLKVAKNDGNDLKVSGLYELSAGEVITGTESGAKAKIKSIDFNEASFDVNYSNLKNIGWSNEVGKLSEDYQVIPDNDYYQNLSYSVKSSITYKEQQSPVENLVHTSGLKNFADTGITSTTSAGIDKIKDQFQIVYDIVDEKRVDTINNFDNVLDQDVINSNSKFLKLETKRLTNYIELKNLNVLEIDDISNQFSNSEAENTEFLSIDEVDDISYQNYLFRVTTDQGNEIQLTDLTILSDGTETVIVENESLQNSDNPYGSFDIFENEFDETFLRFTPVDPFNTDYNVKLIKQTFNTVFAGVGTESVGFIDLTGSVDTETTTVGLGTTTIISLNSSNFESLYVNAQVTDTATQDMNYVRLYITHDGTDTYMSEYYIDNNLSSSTGDSIGLFTCTNLGGGVFSLTHENTTSNKLQIRTNIVGFGTTTSGQGVYRFKSNDQTDGQERSAIYKSSYQSTVSLASTTIDTLDKTLFNSSKSLVQVSIGSSKALHQVMMIFDGSDVYTQQLPFLSVDTTDNTLDSLSGIGTFGGEVSGSNLILKFYPDNQNQQIDIETFSKVFYNEIDVVNSYNNLSYGAVTESIDEKFYNSINGDRINRTDFKLTSKTKSIFSKEFNPNSASLDATTGIFTIEDHFFMTGEELIYTPNSTIVGVGTSAMMTSVTDVLPSTVYAIKVTENTFKVAITTTAAQSGIGTTFTSLGEGNAHRFTMKERNTKCIISVDELVQYPLAFTGITHTLSKNIGIATSILPLSGISSINPKDILLIDDEYMGVINIGFGNTNIGPITNSGSVRLVEVDRGFVGSSPATHTNSSNVQIYKGAFNIVNDEIHFAEPPRGNPQIDKTKSNLEFETSSFNGRVFLKSNYDNNKVYDDISNQFTGIGRTFALTVGGANTTGIGTEGSNGLVFINNIYQSPKTDNNPDRSNYEIFENTTAGITTVVFSGITKPNTDPLEYVTSNFDVNQNETPRGGIIVSYGSTPGLGFAPLVGASVTAVVGAGGSIVSVGLGTTDNLGSGYNGLVSIGVTVFDPTQDAGGDPAVITATANVGAGGTLSFNVSAGGTGYNNPQIFVSDPSYENLPITGVYREGIGNTTTTGIGLLIDVIVGGASTNVGIGSTYFEVKEFNFSRPGYAFKRGDIFKPVGLVTDSNLSSPLSDFTIEVIDTYSDNFAAWEFGELDYIDSIKDLQNGNRRRFPLNYNGQLLGFEPEEGSPLEENINNILVIFINGVIQKPVTNFIFEGGTSVAFTKAPLPEDEIEIYFYKGVDGIDSNSVDNIRPTLKTGDNVQVISNNYIKDTITQNERTVYNVAFSDKVETDRYFDQGIDESNFKPLSWTKQKSDKKINGEFISKSRDVLESLVFPTARIIKDVSTTDTEVFIENSELFSYETDNGYSDNSTPCDGLIIENTNPITATFTASIGSGAVSGITTTNPGFGYLPDQTTIELKFTPPVGVGTTATATASVTAGVVTSVTITNPGSGYTVAPTIVAETPNLNIEKITEFSTIQGSSGIITGITTSTGSGSNPLAIVFSIIDTSSNLSQLSVGYPIYIHETNVGSGVTSINNSDSEIVGIGTTCLDNIYYVSDLSSSLLTGSTYVGVITCNVHSNTNIIGITTTGSHPSNIVGRYSWGRISGGTRSSSPISIGVTGNIVSGLSTYPTIQRRGGTNIRKTGALPKIET